MGTLPQLIEEDIHQFNQELQTLLQKTEATTALVIDQGGFLLTSQGQGEPFDLTTIAALASGSYMANQTLANLVQEDNFNSVYQQGEKFSLLIASVDEYCLLVIIFKAQVGVGVVRYFAAPAILRLAGKLRAAHSRSPQDGLDLSLLNLADTREVFKKRAAGDRPE
jgi:predicted regulator of Ras-like GTPase activity (Roadblock/LC7/MglB family)